jgi:membrane-bound lytic murein transglycosylase B
MLLSIEGKKVGREAAAKKPARRRKSAWQLRRIRIRPFIRRWNGSSQMIGVRQLTAAIFSSLAVFAGISTSADAAQCGSSPAGFEAWKREFAEEARGKGIGASGVAALMGANYASATIAADRGQRSFGLSLDQFLAKRGASSIVARGRALKQSQAALFASIQQRYGVPPGPLLAIWGMETGFGSQRGHQNMLSAVATLAYDCRRPEYFTEQLYATLKLIDRGVLSANTRGSMHGELGQTQFLPKNILAYGTGNLDVAANALTSTANFLKAHGWRAGAGYQPGEANFAAIQAWNSASVYQRAIALMGRQIDGEGGSAAR